MRVLRGGAACADEIRVFSCWERNVGGRRRGRRDGGRVEEGMGGSDEEEEGGGEDERAVICHFSLVLEASMEGRKEREEKGEQIGRGGTFFQLVGV